MSKNEKTNRELVGAGFKPARTTAEGRHGKPQRKSLRFSGYDYSCTGAYFITICTLDRQCLFGCIADGVMQLSRFGSVVEACWSDLPQHYAHVDLDYFVVMPNHIHGIVCLIDGAAIDERGKARHGLPEIVRAFKTSSRRINSLRNKNEPVWQRGYYEHIIRNEESLNQIREYIDINPARWHLDRENPDTVRQQERAGFKPAPTSSDTSQDPDLPPFLRSHR
jgi:putative transposase